MTRPRKITIDERIQKRKEEKEERQARREKSKQRLYYRIVVARKFVNNCAASSECPIAKVILNKVEPETTSTLTYVDQK
jgi:HSP20 family molecular chaperone IbpA